jgi:hypothetical protein
LLLGVQEDGGLKFAGNTGTGFDEKELARVSKLLKARETRTSPFSEQVKTSEPAHWVRPDLVAQVRFTEWTADDRLRHPVYLGLRDDKSARDVVREGAKGAKGASGAKGAGAKGAGAEGAGATQFSLVCGQEYLGMLMPDEFPPLFDARQPINADQIDLGTRAWTAFTATDPMGLLPLAAGEHPALPYLAGAIRRQLEEFPSTANGLARSERQILQVLSEGLRTPEETFVEAARLEDHIFMGDTSFWTIVRRLSEGPRPLVTAAVQPREGRLPSGTLALTTDGAAVLAGRSDHVALNGIDRWLGGVRLTSERLWRWTGSTLRPSP